MDRTATEMAIRQEGSEECWGKSVVEIYREREIAHNQFMKKIFDNLKFTIGPHIEIKSEMKELNLLNN